MGKHDKKTGKGRLDKFYKLAKEQGYRARSAFKLIHLNRKYDLLSKSKCVIDLCAAPGGWLQVAEKYMPKGSLIIGVDLNPIKPLPHVQTFVSDITTPQCRQTLKGLMRDWKADLVMHDGAPNVGSAWVQDAFTQNELVLQSLKLATEFLQKGGNFVTKVFRSQDYNSLMWVFGQLFKHVEATKPPSSRNVSAEIFVVCRDFIAPKHIDPKFLDPKHVFKDVAALPLSITEAPVDPSSSTSISATQASTSRAANAVAKIAAAGASHAHANVFMPEKKRRHREGYVEGDYTNFHVASAEDFVKGPDPVSLLGTISKVEFASDEAKQWLKSRHTTPDVLSNFADLKVLGKGDFKLLMKWRLAIRLETGLDVKAAPEQDVTEEITVEPIDEEEQITEELKKLHEEKMTRQKREKKRSNEKKARDLLKLQLNMTAPEDLDMNDQALAGEAEMFDLDEGESNMRRAGKSGDIGEMMGDGMDLSDSEAEDGDSEAAAGDENDEIFDSDEERELKIGALEGELDGLYDKYQEHRNEKDAKWKVKQARMKDKNYDAWHGIKASGDASDSEDEDDGVDKHRNIVRVPRRGDAAEESEAESEVGGWEVRAAARAKLGEEADSDDSDEEEARQRKKAKVEGSMNKARRVMIDEEERKPKRLVTSLQDAEQRAQMSRQAQLWFDQSVFKGVGDLAALDGDDEEDDDDDDDEDREEEEGSDEDEEMEEDSEDSGASSEEDEDEDVDMAGSSRTSPSIGEDDDDDFEIVPRDKEDDAPEWDVDDEDQDEVKRKIIKDKGLLTAEAVTLATQLVNRQITASQLMDSGFNRLSTFHKDGLPSWFLDDESKHYKANIPITKEAVNVLREKQRALDARPIKKVAEAKARKKFKAAKRLESARKKADGVMEADDLNMTEKARQVGKVMGRAKGPEKKKEKKVVVAKGANRGIKGRPKGVKGKYKIVDGRMKKEVRAEKRAKKASKRR